MYRHGEYRTRLYKAWSSMLERCRRKKSAHYKDYGGRGITVCDEWLDYIPFSQWAKANGYSYDLSLDRIDYNGNYEPSNCRWVTFKEQQNNKRKNRIIVYRGQKYTLQQLAEKSDIKRATLESRLNRGMSVEDAVNKPVKTKSCGARMRD